MTKKDEYEFNLFNDKNEEENQKKNEDKKEDKIEEIVNENNEEKEIEYFNLLENNIYDQNELKENESYSCTECSSDIEITSIDESSNILSFICPLHGAKTIPIKDYLNDMKKNTYLYCKCYSCKKQQNQINNNEIFNFCTNCQLVICNDCSKNHNISHLIIKNNKIKIKCNLHPDKNNISYCLDCNCHLCNECLKHRKHMSHRKKNIEEIEPSNEEMNSLLKIINDYKDKKNNFQLEKNNKLCEIENQYNIDKERENGDYISIILKTKKELENEIIDNEKNYNNEIYELKKKYEKELILKKEELDKKNKIINDKYKKINENNKNTYDDNLNVLEEKYKNEIKKIENYFEQKISHYDELLNINDIIYNTYIKSKENYYHNTVFLNKIVKINYLI